MKKKKIALILILTLAFCLIATGTTLAMSSDNFNLPWTVFSSGGAEDRSSSSYILSDTIGQPSAIGESQSTNYRLGSGFWYGAPVTVGCIPGDANEDGKIDSGDLVKVLRIILEVNNPTCGADADQDGNIDSGDLVKVLRIILGVE